MPFLNFLFDKKYDPYLPMLSIFDKRSSKIFFIVGSAVFIYGNNFGLSAKITSLVSAMKASNFPTTTRNFVYPNVQLNGGSNTWVLN